MIRFAGGIKSEILKTDELEDFLWASSQDDPMSWRQFQMERYQTPSYEKIRLEWCDDEVLDLFQIAITRNDPYILVRYVRNPTKALRPRAAAADMSLELFFFLNEEEKHREVRDEMYKFALKVGHPFTCYEEATLCMKRGNFQRYEYYLRRAAEGGLYEARDKLEEIMEHKMAMNAKPK